MDDGCCRGGDELRNFVVVRGEKPRASTLLSANLLAEIASDAVLEEAYEWLCERRQRYAPNNDVWTLRWRWPAVKAQAQALLLSGQYRFDAMDMIPESEDQVALWSSRDALVLKALALVLTRHLAPLLPKSCCHVINNGGSKAAVRLLASRALRNPPGAGHSEPSAAATASLILEPRSPLATIFPSGPISQTEGMLPTSNALVTLS